MKKIKLENTSDLKNTLTMAMRYFREGKRLAAATIALDIQSRAARMPDPLAGEAEFMAYSLVQRATRDTRFYGDNASFEKDALGQIRAGSQKLFADTTAMYA